MSLIARDVMQADALSVSPDMSLDALEQRRPGPRDVARTLLVRTPVRLDALLERSLSYERRSARLYGGLAERHRADRDLHALWATLAREEEMHAAEVEAAITWVACPAAEVAVEGWQGLLDEIDEALAAAEQLPVGAGLDREFLAALALETTEMDLLRDLLVRLTTPGRRIRVHRPHGASLAEEALRRSVAPEVRAYATFLLERARAERAADVVPPRAKSRQRRPR